MESHENLEFGVTTKFLYDKLTNGVKNIVFFGKWTLGSIDNFLIIKIASECGAFFVSH